MVAGRASFRYQALISLLAILMVNALLTSLSGFWHLDVAQNRLLLYSGAAVLFAWLGWRLPWVTTALLLLTGVGLVAGVYMERLPGVDFYLQTLGGQVSEFIQSIHENQFNASFGPVLGIFFLISIAVLTAVVVIPESLTKGNTFWAIAAGTVVFGTQWAWYYDPAWTHFIAFSTLAFLIWILGQAARRDAAWAGSGRKIGYASHVTTPLAVVLVLAIISMVLPSHWEPLDLGAWGEKAQEAFPVLKQLRGSGVGTGTGRFSLRGTGFSPVLGTLGGPVRLDNTVALYFTVDRPLEETAYLRGSIYQVYDGQTWTRGNPEEIEVTPDGTLPTYFGSDVSRTYLTARVKPALNMGFTVFNLWEPQQIKGLKNGYRADADGYLWANRTITKGTNYEIFARVPTYSADHLRRIGTIGSGDAYLPYLQIAESVPPRVGELTAALTADAPTPYDKAVAIEAFLRSMPYDLNVGPAPDGQDFVDHFLFDLKRGYCVYSATAMTVMLRQVGIPSRMVEGFAIPQSLQYTDDAGGRRTYTVLNSQAHAWVEAYFPNYGWVTFDPTPRGDLPLIDRSAPAPAEPDESGTAGPVEGSDVPATDPNLEEDFNEGRDSTPEDADFTPSPLKREWPWLLTALAAFAGAFLLAWRRLANQERIAAREGRQVVQEVWNKTASLMDQFQYGPQPYQTAAEYARDLGRRWPQLQDSADEVAREYNEARFSPPGHPVPPEAGANAKSFWAKVHAALFVRFGWRIYLWRRLKWRHKA
ncbi:MAG TPA: transglutaminase domain-containing protein [Symbiobacteriaceae bacterium]|nr:transglutaminase domain-containing protein [Symbiobacteriaceae bacterium]